MKALRVIEEVGNNQDYECEVVPRVGERITLDYGIGGQPVTRHYFRVNNVKYRLQNNIEYQAAVLIVEEHHSNCGLLRVGNKTT